MAGRAEHKSSGAGAELGWKDSGPRSRTRDIEAAPDDVSAGDGLKAISCCSERGRGDVWAFSGRARSRCRERPRSLPSQANGKWKDLIGRILGGPHRQGCVVRARTTGVPPLSLYHCYTNCKYSGPDS